MNKRNKRGEGQRRDGAEREGAEEKELKKEGAELSLWIKWELWIVIV